MASRRSRLSVSPSRAERSPSTDLDLGPLTEKPKSTEHRSKMDRSRLTVRTEKRDRTTSKPLSGTSAQPTSTEDRPKTADIPTGDSKVQKLEPNAARSARRRRSKLVSELEIAEQRSHHGLVRVAAHSLLDLLSPLGTQAPTATWTVLPTEATDLYFHMVPVLVNGSHGTSLAVWLPHIGTNLVPSWMIRTENAAPDEQFEMWRLDETTTVEVGNSIEVHLRVGNATALTVARESPQLQVPLLGAPATEALGLFLCPLRHRISTPFGDALSCVRCPRKKGNQI